MSTKRLLGQAEGVADKRMTEDEVVAELRSGMTIGIGGWGSRRKPMSLVRAILRSDLHDLTIVSYGGPDVGLLCAAGKVKRLVYGFVSLDSIPLEPHFRAARESGAVDVTEYDEGMLQWALYAASLRLPFLPTRAGLGSDVMRLNPELRTVTSPYADGEELLAVPALAARRRARSPEPRRRRGQRAVPRARPVLRRPVLRPPPSTRTCPASGSCPTGELLAAGGIASLRIHRWMVAGVVEAPNGAHFTSCAPDYERDEAFQRGVRGGGDRSGDSGREFAAAYLEGNEADYQRAVAARASASDAARQ